MANLNAAIRRVRRTRRHVGAQPSSRFEEFEPEYKAILAELDDLGGDAAFDALTEWLIETTERNGRLPNPAELRQQARQICTRRGIEIPDDSSLQE